MHKSEVVAAFGWTPAMHRAPFWLLSLALSPGPIAFVILFESYPLATDVLSLYLQWQVVPQLCAVLIENENQRNQSQQSFDRTDAPLNNKKCRFRLKLIVASFALAGGADSASRVGTAGGSCHGAARSPDVSRGLREG